MRVHAIYSDSRASSRPAPGVAHLFTLSRRPLGERTIAKRDAIPGRRERTLLEPMPHCLRRLTVAAGVR
jgi:hypothetical protein